jgi:hypothetical protein
MNKLMLLIIAIFCTIAVQAQVITDSLSIEGHYRSFHFTDPGDTKRENLVVLAAMACI